MQGNGSDGLCFGPMYSSRLLDLIVTLSASCRETPSMSPTQ